MVLGAVAIFAPAPAFLGPPCGDARSRAQREPDGTSQEWTAIGLRRGLPAELLDRVRKLPGCGHVQPKGPDEPP